MKDLLLTFAIILAFIFGFSFLIVWGITKTQGGSPAAFIHNNHEYLRFGFGHGKSVVHNPDCKCFKVKQ